MNFTKSERHNLYWEAYEAVCGNEADDAFNFILNKVYNELETDEKIQAFRIKHKNSLAGAVSKKCKELHFVSELYSDERGFDNHYDQRQHQITKICFMIAMTYPKKELFSQ